MYTLWTIVGIITFLGGAYLMYKWTVRRKAKRRAAYPPPTAGTGTGKSTGKRPPKR